MPIKHAIWKVGPTPLQLGEGRLVGETALEEMIVHAPEILSERWLLIGRQEHTSHGGKVDLLALNQDAQLIVVELKRDKTPRDVVAQALDYASWAKDLSASDIAHIFHRFTNGGSLESAFSSKFGQPLDEEQLNASHQVVIVASSLDASTERIVNYLNELDIAINVLFFQVFVHGTEQFLSRAWLIDPVETESKAIAASSNQKGEWNGEFYVSFGHDDERHWDEAVRHGFVSAGGGNWYTNTLWQLSVGSRIWVKVPGRGYVGVGLVDGSPVPFKDVRVQDNGVLRPFVEIAKANYHRTHPDDERTEYFVPVKWIVTRPLDQAVQEVGFFGNQNTVCKPRVSKWQHTVERLRAVFGIPN